MLTSTGSPPRPICSPEESLQTRVNSPLWPSRPRSTPVSYSRTDTCEWHRLCSGSSDRSFLLTCDMLHPSETDYRKRKNIGWTDLMKSNHQIWTTLSFFSTLALYKSSYKKQFVVLCDCGKPDMDGQPAHHRQTSAYSPPAVNLLMACWDRAG